MLQGHPGETINPMTRVRTLRWPLTILGAASLLGAFWFAIGPFSIGPFPCGSAFQGRYISTAGDAAATLSYACLQQAPTRRTLTFLLAALAFSAGFAVCASLLRRTQAQSDARPNFESAPSVSDVVLVVIGGLLALTSLVLLLGGVLALVRVWVM